MLICRAAISFHDRGGGRNARDGGEVAYIEQKRWGGGGGGGEQNLHPHSNIVHAGLAERFS